jgi:3-oxoadipate CoA-transferase alpha subunit
MGKLRGATAAVINKLYPSTVAALEGLKDGATVLISGFGDAGVPFALCNAVLETGVRDLTVVANNAGFAGKGVAALIDAGRVAKIICSFPRSEPNSPFVRQYNAGRIQLELVPQGTLGERMRAAGAGIAGFYTRVSAGTRLAEGKETREFDGHLYVLERPLKGDFALVRAEKADRWGNLVYRKAARNFGPIMATAADVTVVEVAEYVENGTLDPEAIVTPSVYVDRVVVTGPGGPR